MDGIGIAGTPCTTFLEEASERIAQPPQSAVDMSERADAPSTLKRMRASSRERTAQTFTSLPQRQELNSAANTPKVISNVLTH